MGTYQALENALSCRRAAGLDFPYVVLCDFFQLQFIRDFLRSHSYLQLAWRSFHAALTL